MTSTTDYKGLLILDPSVGTGGDMINDDMKEIADRAGPVFSETTDPTANDDGADTGGKGKAYQWSKWLNSSTGQLFVCTDNATGAAVWKRIDADGSGISDVAEDTAPQLGGHLDLNGYSIDLITPTEISRLDGVTSNIQTQIDGKAASNHNHAASELTTGTFADARVAESNVTQHEAAIDHDALTNFNTDEHADHTAIDIIAGTGLLGGGDINASRTLHVNLETLDLPAKTVPAAPASGNFSLWLSDGSYGHAGDLYARINNGTETKIVRLSEFTSAGTMAPSDISDLLVDINPTSDKVFDAASGGSASTDGGAVRRVELDTGPDYTRSGADGATWNASDSDFNNQPSLTFNGLNHYLESTLNTADTKGDLTIVLAYKFTASITQDNVLCVIEEGQSENESDNSMLYLVAQNTPLQLYIHEYDSGANEITQLTNAAYTDSTKTHIQVIRRNVSTFQLASFIDGALTDTDNYTHNPTVTGTTIKSAIGARVGGGKNAKMKLARLLIYKKPLHNEEINQLGNYLRTLYGSI